MRIAVDARPLLFSQKTGVYRYTVSLFKNLAKIDTENEYFLLLPDTTYREEGIDIGRNFRRKRLSNLFDYSYPGQIWEQLFLPKELKQEDFDLYFSSYFVTPILTSLPKVVTIYDTIPLIKQFSLICPKSLRKFHFWTSYSAKSASCVMTISRHSKEDIIRSFRVEEEKVRVAYLAASPIFKIEKDKNLLSRVSQKYNLCHDFILFVGYIDPRKNLANVITAYNNLIKRHRLDYDLIIVGQMGGMAEDVFIQVRELGLEKKVRFLGYVPDEELVYIYNLASLFVWPSLYEGFGLPILEAMVCGLPVITSNTTSLPEVAGDAAVLIDPYKVKELEEAMYRALTDGSLRKEMREKGLRQAGKFTWEKTASQTLDVFREVIEKEERPKRKKRKKVHKDTENYTDILKGQGKVKEILIVRSCRMEQFESALGLFKQRFKDARFSVLVQSQLEEMVKKREEFSDIFVLPEGIFKIFKVKVSLIRRLQKKRFDLFVLLYNDSTDVGYSHLQLLALLSGAKNKIAYSTDGRVYKIDFRQMSKKCLKLIPAPFVLGYIILCFKVKKWKRLFFRRKI